MQGWDQASNAAVPCKGLPSAASCLLARALHAFFVTVLVDIYRVSLRSGPSNTGMRAGLSSLSVSWRCVACV